MAEDTDVRINFSIPETVNDALNELIPRGIKAEVFRKLTEMYIKCAAAHGNSIAIDMIEDKMEIRYIPIERKMDIATRPAG